MIWNDGVYLLMRKARGPYVFTCACIYIYIYIYIYICVYSYASLKTFGILRFRHLHPHAEGARPYGGVKQTGVTDKCCSCISAACWICKFNDCVNKLCLNEKNTCGSSTWWIHGIYLLMRKEPLPRPLSPACPAAGVCDHVYVCVYIYIYVYICTYIMYICI